MLLGPLGWDPRRDAGSKLRKNANRNGDFMAISPFFLWGFSGDVDLQTNNHESKSDLYCSKNCSLQPC